MSSSIQQKQYNLFDFVSVDCLLDKQPCVHDCKSKIETARLDTSPLENRIDQLTSQKPFYFTNQDGIVHAYCWIQAANNRTGCFDCKKTIERMEQKVVSETAAPSQSVKKGASSRCLRIGMVALLALALFAAAAILIFPEAPEAGHTEGVSCFTTPIADYCLGYKSTTHGTSCWENKLFRSCVEIKEDGTSMKNITFPYFNKTFIF